MVLATNTMKISANSSSKASKRDGSQLVIWTMGNIVVEGSAFDGIGRCYYTANAFLDTIAWCRQPVHVSNLCLLRFQGRVFWSIPQASVRRDQLCHPYRSRLSTRRLACWRELAGSWLDKSRARNSSLSASSWRSWFRILLPTLRPNCLRCQTWRASANIHLGDT